MTPGETGARPAPGPWPLARERLSSGRRKPDDDGPLGAEPLMLRGGSVRGERAVTVPSLELGTVRGRRQAQPWQLYLLAASLVAVLYFQLEPTHNSALMLNLLELSGAIAVLGGVSRARPPVRAALWCLGLGLLLFLGGDFYSNTYPQLRGVHVPFPSVGDAVNLAAYPALMAGLLLLVKREGRVADGPQMIDSLIMTLGLAVLFWVFLIAPYLSRSLALAPKLIDIGRPTGDVILIGAAIRLALEDSGNRVAIRLLLASVACLLGADFARGLLVLDGAPHLQPALEVGLAGSFVLAGAAALHPSLRSDGSFLAAEPRLTRLRLTLLTCASLIAPVIELTREVGPGNLELHATIDVSVVLFSLVVLRMASLVHSREQSFSRERTLTSAGVMLMAATSRDEIAGAALDAAHALVDGDVSARMCLREPGGMIVFGEGNGSMRSVWSIPGRNLLPGLSEGDGVTELSGPVRTQLRLDGLQPRVVAIELPAARSSTGGVLIVGGELAAAISARSGLRTLVSQVSLALDSNALAEDMHRQESEARISSLVQNASDLITVIDGRAQVVYQSPSIEHVLGYRPEEVVGRPFAKLLHPTEKGRLLRRLTSGGSGRGHAEPIECALRHQDGSVRHFEIVPTNMLDDGAVQGIVLNGRDVSERREFEEQLTRQAFHDPVTHLANRALFTERVRHAVARSLRERIGLAVIFMDLDEFKLVNDSLGHAAGDRVLLEVAQRVVASVRGGDTVARFGSDEFAVLLEDIEGAEAAAEIAERILIALTEPLRLGASDVTVRASLGLSIAEPGCPSDAEELTRNADAAMYIAKADGVGGYRLFEPAMHELVRGRLELRADLQRALGEQQFELYFQPIVRLADAEVSSVEALLRWNHPTRGLVPPDQFIPFAEESGLIIPIGGWVLREGCRRLLEIRERSGAQKLTISVNLSVEQLLRHDIFTDVCEVLEDTRLDPTALTLEITESAMMTDIDEAVERLIELKGLGVRLALDDFGTGYSSLSYLARFPIDMLKMDRSLLGSGEAEITSGLTEAVLSLGHTFGAVVVAEGVELSEQCDTLKALGCELVQGYYYAKPMPLDMLVAYLSESSSEQQARSATSP